MPIFRRIYPIACLSALFFCGAALAQQGSQGALALDGAAPYSPEGLSAPPTDAWRTNGGSLRNERYSPLDQINRDNVSELKGVWRAHLDGSGMGTRNSAEAQPLFDDGVLYVITGDHDVFALNIEDGSRKWKYETVFPENFGSTVCCGWTSRGVAMSEDKIFIGRLDSRLIALDKETGEVVWDIEAADWRDGYTITSAPLYFDGMVITGFAGAELGVRGMLKAYDADSGEHIWTFYTIPGPGEFGHDTWPQDNDVWRFGGGTVWQTPAVDAELGMIYFSTGNPGPDFDGSVRAGDNLFTASIVALDVYTGEYRWHFQQVHHDIWDYDAPNPVILFDMEYKGVQRRALAEAPKTGWVYILDRVTGEPIIGVEERPVPQEPDQLTSPTQPYPIGDSFVPQFIDIPPEGTVVVNEGRIFTPFGINKPVLVQPSPAGSANWPPSAYDPARNQMFICATETGFTMVQEPVGEIPEDYQGEIWTGGGVGGANMPQRGVIAAMDMYTNTLVWQWRWPESCYSGFVATGGDLLFVGRNDGRLTALDTDTGNKLWEFQTGAGMNNTVSIFEWEGTQYIAAYSGGNMFAGSHKGDSVWLFSLDGTLEQTTPGDTIQAVTGNQAGATQVVFAEGEPDYAAGEELFRLSCQACHGPDGMGGHNNGAPLNELRDIRAAISIVTTGRNAMPAFAGALSPEQIRDVSGFVVDRLFADQPGP